MPFVQFVKEMMDQVSLRATDLAQEADIDIGYLGRLLSGQRKPPIQPVLLQRLESALGVPWRRLRVESVADRAVIAAFPREYDLSAERRAELAGRLAEEMAKELEEG